MTKRIAQMKQSGWLSPEFSMPHARTGLEGILADPKYVMQWWGPKGFTSPVCRRWIFAFGGKFLCCMRTPDGPGVLERRRIPRDCSAREDRLFHVLL